MKWCNTCERNLDESCFTKNKAKKDGLSSNCKECKRTQQDNWYQSHKADHLKRVGVRRKSVNKENKKKIREILEKSSCLDCGNNNPIVLDFDHVRGKKKMHVSRMLSSYAWYAIEEEIAKCEIVCANCHRIRTFSRAGWSR